jgi:LmbE family N-acetylglucosaminyl deacetylase
VTTTLKVGQYVDTKITSLNCHRTQIGSNGPFARLPEETMREYMSTEYYTLVRLEGMSKREDLLAGL